MQLMVWNHVFSHYVLVFQIQGIEWGSGGKDRVDQDGGGERKKKIIGQNN